MFDACVRVDARRMLAQLRRRFEPFAALERATLCSIGRHARVAVRGAAHAGGERRKQHGSCYLVKGVVRRRDAAGRDIQIADQDAAARDDHGMHRFLGPGLVECLPPSSLQAVFRAFEPIRVCAGEIVVREGDRGDLFYVIANGSVQVRRDGRRLVALVAGDSFDADARVSGGRRNATVVMTCDGRVMAMTADSLRGLVVERRVDWIEVDAAGMHRIDLSAWPCEPDALRRLAGELDLGATYVFDGATEGDRALATFLAKQRERAFARRFRS
jgi:hypothetical protein